MEKDSEVSVVAYFSGRFPSPDMNVLYIHTEWCYCVVCIGMAQCSVAVLQR